MDSAGGAAKQARDAKFQAILPLRGKPLNVEGEPMATVLSNAEFKSLIVALGCGFGENYNVEKLNYNKIIFLADADPDGYHITSLLITFFVRFMPELINDGKVYTACPPLFGVREGRANKEGLKYFWNYKEVQDYINKKGLKQGQYELKRFKG